MHLLIDSSVEGQYITLIQVLFSVRRALSYDDSHYTTSIFFFSQYYVGALRVTVITEWIRIGNASSNPERGCLYFNSPLEKAWIHLPTPSYGQIVDKLDSLVLVRQPV